jgi:hypothetical protein
VNEIGMEMHLKSNNFHSYSLLITPTCLGLKGLVVVVVVLITHQIQLLNSLPQGVKPRSWDATKDTTTIMQHTCLQIYLTIELRKHIVQWYTNEQYGIKCLFLRAKKLLPCLQFLMTKMNSPSKYAPKDIFPSLIS